MVDVQVLAAPGPSGPDVERPPMVASLSPSSMATWRQCPKRFFFEKILRLDVEPGEAAVCGSFVHLVLEHLMGRPSGQRTAEAARGIAAELWPVFTTDAESRFADLTLDADATRAFKQRAWAGIVGYFDIEDPNVVDVVGTEQEVRAELDGAPVYGIIDRIDREGDGLVVTDYKSGKAPTWEDEREEKLGQLRTYAALLEATGRRVTELRLLFVSPQLAARTRSERCTAAAAAAEEALFAEVGDWDRAIGAVGGVESAMAAARAGAPDPVAARSAGDEAALAAASDAAARLGATDPPAVTILLLEAVAARRRAFFARRSLERCRPTSVKLRVQDADLELARAEARGIWAEATACYEAWEFPAHTGVLCDWCPFAERCEAFQAWDAAGRPDPPG